MWFLPVSVEIDGNGGSVRRGSVLVSGMEFDFELILSTCLRLVASGDNSGDVSGDVSSQPSGRIFNGGGRWRARGAKTSMEGNGGQEVSETGCCCCCCLFTACSRCV